MDRIYFVIFILLGSSDAVIYRLNVSEYNKMPPLYGLDDYDACMANPGGTFCVVDVNLQAGSNKELMKMIQEYSDYKIKHFNHTQIHRGVCVTMTCKEFLKNPDTNGSALDDVLGACLNQSMYTQYGLEGELANVLYCNKEGEEMMIDTGDIIVAVVYLGLIVINVVGSFYDIWYCKLEEKSGNPYLLAFSMRRNWARLTAPNTNQREPRLERLKLFHGMRAMTMFCVFFSHTTLIMSYSYVANPLYIETAYDDPLKQLLFNGSLVTHTFFVMSSFLLAYNFMLHTEKHAISWWHLPKGILLRWLRLTPTYALTLFTITTWMRHAFSGPLWQLVVTSEADACRQYWYLAADTQLFIMGLLVCVVARSCRARVLSLSVLLVVALAIVAGHTYFQDLDAVVIQSPESYRNLYATDNTFRLLYARGHTNMSTYILGLAGGFLAYHWQNGKNIDNYKKHRWVVWLAFPLGVAVILSGGLFYQDGGRASTVLRVLYATLYKPVFQILVVTIILGTVFKFENVYRSVVEWRGWTWMGRVSYSAFLLHTVFQRALVGAQTQLIYMSDYYVVVVLSATILVTYICACGAWLCVEAPAAGLIRAALSPDKKHNDNVTKV
ncbi:nose resistant to fluoxetine protein 6-like isoform X2 [Anticarsia gemmatalis]|uniref:nose resistant to fluoxetine protein 6-like isoform X2 n=1 Tax=Anticarsia gemmatalis TaxID=129554 RepID=UPI003F764639